MIKAKKPTVKKLVKDKVASKKAVAKVEEKVVEKIVEKIIFKPKIVYQDKIVEREKIVYVVKEVETEMPTLPFCKICNVAPALESRNDSFNFTNQMNFSIVCKKCNLTVQALVDKSYRADLFPAIYDAINKWNMLTSHLTIKESK